MFKMIATSGFVTALECTKFVFGRGSPDPLAGLRGPSSKGRERGKERDEGREEEREGIIGTAPFRIFLDPPLSIFCKLDFKNLKFNGECAGGLT